MVVVCLFVRLSVRPSVVVCHGCIVPKRCDMKFRLLLITNKKSHIGFKWHKNHWPWMTLKSHIAHGMRIVRSSDYTVSRRGSAVGHRIGRWRLCNRLSIVTMFLSAAVWSQLLMESFKLQVALFRKWWEIGPRLLLISNRKSHTPF